MHQEISISELLFKTSNISLFQIIEFCEMFDFKKKYDLTKVNEFIETNWTNYIKYDIPINSFINN